MITSEWPTPERVGHVPFITRQVDFLRRAGVDVDVFHFRGARNPLNYLRAWRGVRRKLRETPYDLLHAQWGQSALLSLPKSLPLVITFRGDDLEGIIGRRGQKTFSGWVLRIISKNVARLADEIIVVADRLARHLSAKSYQVIPSGLDLDLFRPEAQLEARKKLGLSLTTKLVLFGGAPSNIRKRYSLAQAAVAELGDRFDVELVVAAGVPHSTIATFMNACDVLLLTSLHEGSPNVVKEALACDLPVVSVDVGDVRERIASVEGCVLCDNDHPTTIAAALMKVLSRAQRVEGRIAVLDLDERTIAQKVLRTYISAISHSSQRCLDPEHTGQLR